MGRLIIASNRTAAGQERAGGVAVALWEALKSREAGLWFGWSGEVTEGTEETLHKSEEDGVSFALADLSETEHAQFYLGYANRALWPVCHYRVDLAHFEESDFDGYFNVNRRFGRLLASLLRAGDDVWINDYQFLLMAEALRECGWRGRIGFFLHIPFPAPEVFRSVPQHARLARAMFQYDLVGFQTSRDKENFRRYLLEECDAEDVDGDHVRAFGRSVQLGSFPIGIDAQEFARTSTSEQADTAANRLKRFMPDRAHIIGVDRMDYSKGLPSRFEAVRRLFEEYPNLCGRVSYTQILPVSRAEVDEYAELRDELDRLAGRINGDHADLDWIPIRYLVRSYPRVELAGLFRLARIGLVTPFYDGMNLVAKEFVAAQDPEDPGVLVLSEFAGAADQLQGALVVNPHDTIRMADTIKSGLELPLKERQERWRAMWKILTQEDIGWWYRSFLSALGQSASAERTP